MNSKYLKLNRASAIMVVCIIVFLIGCTGREASDANDNRKVVASNDSVEILCEVIDSAKDEFDVDVVAVWSRDLKSGEMNKIFQTVRMREYFGWYMPDGNKFIPVSIDSIPCAQVFNCREFNNSQIIVSGCPDMRNTYSFLVDISKRKAWFVPSNFGFLGETSEEGFLIFKSYRYNPSDNDTIVYGGRHSFLQVFNDAGEMIDSLSFEKYRGHNMPIKDYEQYMNMSPDTDTEEM